MSTHTCHECGEAIPDGAEVWRAPESGLPDETGGEPFCPSCAHPLGIAA